MEFAMTTALSVLDAIEKHTNVLLYGPPGTGKSHLMKQVQNLFLEKYSGGQSKSYSIETTAERRAIAVMPGGRGATRWVTFHQGYAYEDFVIGLRPQAGAAQQRVLAADTKPQAERGAACAGRLPRRHLRAPERQQAGKPNELGRNLNLNSVRTRWLQC